MSDLTHDIRVWLTAEQYAGLLRKAHEDERPISAYVRRLIAKDLDESLEPAQSPRYARGGFTAGRSGPSFD